MSKLNKMTNKPWCVWGGAVDVYYENEWMMRIIVRVNPQHKRRKYLINVFHPTKTIPAAWKSKAVLAPLYTHTPGGIANPNEKSVLTFGGAGKAESFCSIQ